jgi:glycosyltransferase involved in cell wall biosynthesis
MTPGPILYEVDNLTLRAGTGIATYARNLAQAASRLGYSADAVFSVAQKLSSQDSRLNEILAFDAPRERESSLNSLLRHVWSPFSALRGIRLTELSLSGLVVGPATDTFRSFNRVFAASNLVDTAVAHFWLYEKIAQLKPPQRPWLFHATQAVPLAVKGCPNIYTVHDLVPLRLPYATLDDKRYFYRLMMALGKTADHIVTVSEHSRQDIAKVLNVDERRITNTYQPVSIPPHLLARSNDDIAVDLERIFGLTMGEYFLFYGAIEPKKNVARLIDAYAASGTKHPLIVVSGNGWQNSVDLRKIRDERFAGFKLEGNVMSRHRQVRRLDYLPLDNLVSLIRGARAVVFPSIYEGFGLPVIEAMLLGTPVITSNVSSLPEIAGDAALLVDPYSVSDIAQAIRTIDSDADLRRALAEKGRIQAKKFSVENYDQHLGELYRQF